MLHQNYYFLKPLGEELHLKMQGMELATCFTQNKDEIILGFCNSQQDFYIRTVLQPDFACLNTLEEFQRAKKNTLDLFEILIGLKVLKVGALTNDRSLAISLEKDYTILFKMYGGRSNVVVFQQNNVVDLFHKKLQNDWDLELSSIPKKIDQTKSNFLSLGGNIKQLYPTFDKTLLSQITAEEMELRWQQLEHLLAQLNKKRFYVGLYNGLPALHLLPDFLNEPKEYTSALEALNAYYYAYAKVSHLEKERNQALKSLQKAIEKTKNYVEKTYQKMEELSDSHDLEKIGHILMANLHRIPEKAEKITLENFYTQKEITIKLKKELSPQKNAEWYYKKAKNQKIEIAKLEENLQARELHLAMLQNHLQQIESIENLRDLRSYLKKNALDFQDEKQEQGSPFRSFQIEGFTVLVGRNAQNNDLLTQKYAYKEDLWLHAKDVSGSHVVIKYQAGKAFPKTVIEKAAQLAAYFSKRKNETLCPVIVTPKKFVRKTKDLDFGQVIVEKETVVMVEPSLSFD
jgi:predicted ribosome quality control (RQC) complex YloA/Tae2 family protein